MIQAEISIYPLATKTTSVSFYIAKAIESIKNIENLRYEINSMGTILESNDMDIIKGMGFSTNNIFRSYQLSKCAPFPGTKLYKQMETQLDEKTLKTYTAYDGGQDTIMKAS